MSTYALNLVKGLYQAGHEVTVLAQYWGDAQADAYRDGPPVYVPEATVVGMQRYGEEAGGDFEQDVERLVGMVTQLHRERPFNVLHAQYGYPTGLAVVEAGKRLRLPTVVSIQGGDGHWVGSCCHYHRVAMRLVLLNAGEVVVGTRSFADEVCRNNAVRRPLQVITGATDASLFRPLPQLERLRLRVRRGIPPDARVILYHGRLDRRKGLVELIEAVAILRERMPAIRLVFSGVGPDQDLVERRVRETRLTDITDFLGYAPYGDAPKIYSLGDVFCIPTHAEGFSNTIVEALACGTPVVSARVVGVADVFGDSPAVRLVDAHDSVGLAGALADVLALEPRRLEMAEAGRQLVLRSFDWSRVAAEYVSIYERLVGRPGAQTRWELPRPDYGCRFRKNPQLL